MVTVKNLSSVDHKRIRLTPVDGAVANISQSQGAIAKDGDNVLICLAPMVEEIPSNEIHFITTAGTVAYIGNQGDQILLSDGSTVNITTTDTPVTFTVPSGGHKVVLSEDESRATNISIGGGALTELINFPTLSTVTKFNFYPRGQGNPENLIKVPEYLPPNLVNLESMFSDASIFNQDLSMWDTTNVTDMHDMFYSASAFNGDISTWNTSNVTDMSSMFYMAYAFNQPLNTWDVSNVTTLYSMFYYAEAFNQDLNNWNTSNVTNLGYVFEGAQVFNGDISTWDTANATDMAGMFDDTPLFNQDLSQWNTSNVTSMANMFRDATSFNSDISNWNTSNVSNMYRMFKGAVSFNQDLSQWCVPLIAYIPSSFDENAPLFTTDKHPVWGTCPAKPEDDEIPSNEMHFTTLAGSADYVGTQGDQILLSDGTILDVTATDETFTFDVPAGKHKVKLVESIDRSNFVSVGGGALVELHNFPTLSTVTKFNFSTHEYNDAPNLTKVPEHFPSNIEDIEDLFNTTENFNQDISMWDVSNVKIFDYVFSYTPLFNHPLNSWDVSGATSMRALFVGAPAYNYPLNSWDVSNVTNMWRMFEGATSFNQDLSSWNVSKVINMSAMFRGASAFNQNLSQWCVPLVTSLPSDFATGATLFTVDKHPVWGTCPRGEITQPNEMYFTTTAGTIEYYGVAGDQIVLNDGTTVILENDSKYDIAAPSGKHKVVLVESRSHDYVGLGGVALVEIHNFPTLGSVNTFDTCPNTSSPNLVKVPTVLPSNITHIQYMFSGATSFNQDISMWDTSNVVHMFFTFSGASAFNQDISMWDTSKVTDMYNMFENAISFNQDLSQWCVPMIASLPNAFADGATLFTSDKHPVWGTCPRGENLIKTGFMNLKIDTTNATLTTEDLNQYLGFDVKPNESVTIDWGDGTIVRVDDTNGTWVELNHTYQVGNIYTLSIETINIDFIEARGKLITEIVDFGLGDTLRDLNAVNLIKVPNILPSHITELASLFYDATSFNQDISGWDTSNVTSMNGMFKGAASFNQDISAWDVSKVTDMFSMFEGATSFNADIGGWDVSNVTKMTAMFRDATAFNQNLSQWCVGLIPALPTAFDTGATLFTTDKHPVWGTCPVV